MNNIKTTPTIEVTASDASSRKSTIEVRIGKQARCFLISNNNIGEAKTQMEKAVEGFGELTSGVQSMLENIALYYA
jgi:hypothetical protein